jgi:hypothetical protein
LIQGASSYLHPARNFTRASAGTAIDAAGNIVEFGNNVPRFGRDGLVIEDTRTNRFLNSLAPVTQNITVTAVAHVLSLMGTGSITLSGAATGTLNGLGAGIPASLVFTPSAGTLTLTVSGSLAVAQLEIGAFASSFIVTAGAALTRLSDVLTWPLASLGIPASGLCTFVGSLLIPRGVGLGFKTILQLDANDDAFRWLLRNGDGNAFPQLIRLSPGTATANLATITDGVVARFALALDGAGRGAISLNGAAPVVLTGGPTVLTTLRIQSRGSSQQSFGSFPNFSIYPGVALSDATLRTLSA